MTFSNPRWVKDLATRSIFPLIEGFWAAGFALLGRIRPAARMTRAWEGAGGKRVVIVAPHPDDETIGAGGVAILHRQAGDHVVMVVVTDGRASRAGGLDAETMARRRASEIEAAGEVLGISELVQLGLPEGAWAAPELARRLAPLLTGADILYASSCVDYHPEHIAVARVVAEIVDAGQTVRAYQVGVPLTTRLANLVADIGELEPAKRQALECFDSQANTLATAGRIGRYLARQYRLPAVELFWEMPGDVYTRVIDGAGSQGRNSFRGIRRVPISDPLAWIIGGRARERLRSRAESLSADPLQRPSRSPFALPPYDA